MYHKKAQTELTSQPVFIMDSREMPYQSMLNV